MGSIQDVRPDPTQDLAWSDWKGSIHDVFTSNALKHPDRICVVETPSSQTSGREFTYRTILEAANVVAHYLLHKGVERGHVVMIYAFRGVDLVIAVIGVLKAGATFSVIDPAYPPDRQLIYLDVARPRALIIIEKAAEEAGKLDLKVRTFFDESLHILAEIPGLKLNDDGSISGGSTSAQDVLKPYLSQMSEVPKTIVGPDSIPTLSFTSGSEGRPKGVQGRHFSLTHYFPWMASHFKIGDQDRFTMLSGIAHDPIQRDIFTPLFLGAQIYIPSSEDIAHGKLAEWVSRYQATVTHLTPAMGQILVGGAEAKMPSLRLAFFVGDVLIKRDCRALQRLAVNASIVNMFGTTETQRAVSYFQIPSRGTDPVFLDGVKEVVPAGRGMKNVQLLVVNREDRTKLCDIGESGEIYVRAAGLAEGYLSLPESNQEKFIQNWFTDPAYNTRLKGTETPDLKLEPWRAYYKGPRDRLYRSGDLGRYMPNGDVECTGRADNQIKIRGFRIELGEIDAHLSSHPLVRENVTVVRRDKNEEMQLVSYIIADHARWMNWENEQGNHNEDMAEDMVSVLRRYRNLRAEVRDFLKTELPVYAVPSVIVPLIRMPLNPNGKPDRPALPFPEAAELVAAGSLQPSASLIPETETEKRVASIWAKYLPLEDASSIARDDSFFDIGGHSILAQRMLLDLRKGWPMVNPNIGLLLKNPTLRGLSSQLDTPAKRDGQTQAGPDITQKSTYNTDAEELLATLPEMVSYSSSPVNAYPSSILLTGATGFLGSYVLKELLTQAAVFKVTVLIRARDTSLARGRLQTAWDAYSLGDLPARDRLCILCGDISLPHYGLSDAGWSELETSIDSIIHNGAWVHWVYPYSHLRASNVLSTIEAIRLCASGKPKSLTFVSSTSVLDSPHYSKLSNTLRARGEPGIPETDDLSGSQSDLGTGYGQTKWVSEYLVRKLGEKWLKARIIRPGYVLGDSKTGITNTDDFLVRLLKAVTQVGKYPIIDNGLNMVPVDEVARVVTCSALDVPKHWAEVAQVDAPQRLTMTQLCQSIPSAGYTVERVSYHEWKDAVEGYVTSSQDGDFALLPLFEFVMGDLPGNTRAPVLDTRNSSRLLANRSRPGISGVTAPILDKYVSDLLSTGFLTPPSGMKQPALIGARRQAALKVIGGRSGVA